MPELPEVEVTKQGIEPHIQGRKVTAVHIYDGRLRWPIPKNLGKILIGQKLHQIKRRGKYLLLRFDEGHLIIHLGMTGVLRVMTSLDELKKHDRVEIQFGKKILRLHDPRKFGAVLWSSDEDGEIDHHGGHHRSIPGEGGKHKPADDARGVDAAAVGAGVLTWIWQEALRRWTVLRFV